MQQSRHCFLHLWSSGSKIPKVEEKQSFVRDEMRRCKAWANSNRLSPWSQSVGKQGYSMIQRSWQQFQTPVRQSEQRNPAAIRQKAGQYFHYGELWICSRTCLYCVWIGMWGAVSERERCNILFKIVCLLNFWFRLIASHLACFCIFCPTVALQ